MRSRWQRARSVLTAVLALAAAGLTLWAGLRFDTSWDWTAAGANRLSDPALELLRALDGPVSILVSVPGRGPGVEQVRSLLGAFRRAKPDLTFELIDPRRSPARAAAADLSRPYRARIEYAARSEHAAELSEQSVVNALYRLSLGGPRWVAAIGGHGERDLGGRANHDLGLFGAQLRSRGFEPRTVDLTRAGAIPDNSVLAVLASPRTALLPAERDAVARFVERGGNLLWLLDPDDVAAQGAQAAPDADLLHGLLGVRAIRGTVISPELPGLRGLEPTIALASEYPEHPLTRDLRLTTLFPGARALEPLGSTAWQVRALVRSPEQSWNETGPVLPNPAHDPGKERRGPLTLGLALERSRPGGDTPQRVVVMGDADFLSNRYLANQGNLQLGLRILGWLGERGAGIEIPRAPVRDTALSLHGRALQALAFFAALGFPAALLITGIVIRWRRRRL